MGSVPQNICSCVLLLVFYLLLLFFRPACAAWGAAFFAEKHVAPILCYGLGGVLGSGSVPTPTPWDGRSLVGRLHPPLKGGWPLRTPPTNQHPQSFGQTPEWIRSDTSDPCEGAGVDGGGRHQGVSTKVS